MAYTIQWNLIGMAVSGDVDGLTIYTDRFGRKVAFTKSPPEKPPSPLQVTQRDRFRQAVAAWNELTPAEKAAYETLSLKTAAVLTGHNIFVRVALTHEFAALETVQEQTGIAVTTPPAL